MQKIGNEPYVVCLVTAYSEGEEGISNTLTSLAETDYPDSRKLLFVVADGMVTGSGESMSTPDICVGLLDADVRFGTPMPMSFISVAQGAKMHNMAMVYAGHYTRGKGHRTPMVVVVKCGTPGEAGENKPGNRGKRDGQMILMNFFQRVTYNDRMTPLDFDLFRKLHALMSVTPDFFELCMMVRLRVRLRVCPC
jgi:chitin synthase